MSLYTLLCLVFLQQKIWIDAQGNWYNARCQNNWKEEHRSKQRTDTSLLTFDLPEKEASYQRSAEMPQLFAVWLCSHSHFISAVRGSDWARPSNQIWPENNWKIWNEENNYLAVQLNRGHWESSRDHYVDRLVWPQQAPATLCFSASEYSIPLFTLLPNKLLTVCMPTWVIAKLKPMLSPVYPLRAFVVFCTKQAKETLS